MIDLFLHPNSVPFTVALGILVVLAMVQVGMSLFGIGGDLEADADVDVDAPSGWDFLLLGELPITIIAILGLAGFSLTGLLIQIIAKGSLSPWLVAIPAVLAGVGAIRGIGGPLSRALNDQRGHALKADALVGHEAIIVLGTASQGSPSQAKVKDNRGQTHYVLVEPLRPQDQFNQGDTVVLAQREGATFRVVRNSVDLFDTPSSMEEDRLRQSTGDS